MTRSSPAVDEQFVYFDPFLLDRARINAGLSRKQLATKAKVAVNTLLDYFRYHELKSLGRESSDSVPGQRRSANDSGHSARTGNSRTTLTGRFRPGTARLIANALGLDVVDLLAPWDPNYLPPKNPGGPLTGNSEWESLGYLDQGRLAPNGLYYIVCRMQHRHIRGKVGRGKFYHLSWVRASSRQLMVHRLARHAETSARVGAHPHLALNLSATPVGSDEGWWVIDDWVGQRTLADYLELGPWPKETLPRLLHEIALGLDALHQSGVILRELAPVRVLISDTDARAVLTDFELAKLLDGSASVSSEWPEDPFRAPEVDGGTANIQSDLYSFGQLALAAAGGEPGETSDIATIFAQVGMPKTLVQRLQRCQEVFPKQRPTSLAPLLKDLARWKGR
jgi:serine/threonine protein kinase